MSTATLPFNSAYEFLWATLHTDPRFETWRFRENDFGGDPEADPPKPPTGKVWSLIVVLKRGLLPEDQRQVGVDEANTFDEARFFCVDPVDLAQLRAVQMWRAIDAALIQRGITR